MCAGVCGGEILFNKELLKQYISEYKKNFDDICYGKEHRVIYKWEAVEHLKSI